VIEVVGVTRVIELRAPIQLSAARAEVERERAPPTRRGVPHEARGVVGARGALEAVKDEQAGGAGRRLAVHPVEVDEVAVGQDDALPPRPDPVTAEERAPDGLEMAVPAPPGRPERSGDYS